MGAKKEGGGKTGKKHSTTEEEEKKKQTKHTQTYKPKYTLCVDFGIGLAGRWHGHFQPTSPKLKCKLVTYKLVFHETNGTIRMFCSLHNTKAKHAAATATAAATVASKLVCIHKE